MLQCDKCGGKIIQDARFCPHCGDPVTEADQPVTELSTSSIANVEISFGRSSSGTYDQAVRIAKNLPTYREEGEGKNIRHVITLPISEVDLLVNMYEMVGSWKSSQMLINGQPAKKSSLTFHSVGCFRKRQSAFDRNLHCYGENEYERNIWGCKRLNMPLYPWGGGWLEFGSMDQGGVWHFDKPRIRHELETGIHENDLCPVLDRDHIMQTFESLPDTINPKADTRWTYDTDYREIGGDYREVAIGIRPVIKKAAGYILGGYEPEWDEETGSEGGLPSGVKVKVTVTPREDPQRPDNYVNPVIAWSVVIGSMLALIIAVSCLTGLK